MMSICLCETRPALRFSAGILLLASVLTPGSTAASHLRDVRPHGPILEAPDLGWGLGHRRDRELAPPFSRPIRHPKEPVEPEPHASQLDAPERVDQAPPAPSAQEKRGDVKVVHASHDEGAMLKEAADAHGEEPHAGLKGQPLPVIDNFIIVYWSGVVIVCIVAWFYLKAQHVDPKAFAEGGAYHDSAGASAWKWHSLQKKASSGDLGVIEFTADGAGRHTGEPLIKCNGNYFWAGQHNGKEKYTNSEGAIVFFDKEWKMNHCDDTTNCCFSSGSASGWEPPCKMWTSGFEDGETILLQDSKLEVTHLPENMWSLCLVAALGQAKLPSPSDKKDQLCLRASLVAAISILMATVQLFALFLICHDTDPNSDPVTTDPATPYGSPGSVNCMKVIMTFLLAIALVSEAGQCKATFQTGLEVHASRLKAPRWLPLAMISLQYVMGIAVVWAGCCAILSFQSVPDIIYSSMAITCISNVDEIFYEAFQEIVGLDADFRVKKREITDDFEDNAGETTPRDHRTSVRPLPLAFHFAAKLSLFFPMLFAVAVFGRAWYTGHMPSERITMITSGGFGN